MRRKMRISYLIFQNRALGACVCVSLRAGLCFRYGNLKEILMIFIFSFSLLVSLILLQIELLLSALIFAFSHRQHRHIWFVFHTFYICGLENTHSAVNQTIQFMHKHIFSSIEEKQIQTIYTSGNEKQKTVSWKL